MKRSKLEICIETLQVLAFRGSLNITHISYNANVNCGVIKEYLETLTKQGLVEEKKVGKSRIFYSITERGVTVLKHFKVLKEALLIIKEDPSK